MIIVVKSLASCLYIGSGGSLGRAGPVVHIGAALGPTLGQILHMSDERIRNPAACGAEPTPSLPEKPKLLPFEEV